VGPQGQVDLLVRQVLQELMLLGLVVLQDQAVLAVLQDQLVLMLQDHLDPQAHQDHLGLQELTQQGLADRAGPVAQVVLVDRQE